MGKDIIAEVLNLQKDSEEVKILWLKMYKVGGTSGVKRLSR